MGFSQVNNRKTLDTILLFGQSNEGGDNAATSGTALYQSVQNNSYIFHKPNDSSSTNNGNIQTLLLGTNNNWVSVMLPSQGPEGSLGYQYFQTTGKPLLMIKYAVGGSCLVDDGTVSTNGLWQWDANLANSNNQLHYSNAINNFVIPCILRMKSSGVDLNIKAVHWCQGEGDALSVNRANAYQTTLIALFDKIQEVLTPYGVLANNYKPIISRIHNNFNPARSQQNAIRTALVNVANYYGSNWINTDAYPTRTDDGFTHWTKVGQEQHGIDISNILSSM